MSSELRVEGPGEEKNEPCKGEVNDRRMRMSETSPHERSDRKNANERSEESIMEGKRAVD